MPTERRAGLMDNQRTELQPTHDAMLAWKSACALYQILPGLRGFWPMSGQDTATTDPTGIVWLLNQSGNSGAILQYVRGTGEELGYSGIIPYAAVYGAGEPYLLGTIASEYRITGTETYIAAAQRGLTIGAWWKFTATSTAEGLMGRDDGSGLTWSYYLEKQATDYPRFVVTNNGSSATTALRFATGMTPIITPLPRALTDDDRLKSESTLTGKENSERHVWVAPNNEIRVHEVYRYR